MAEITISTKAFGVVEKIAAKHGATASHVYLPVEWTGRKVMILLVEPLDDQETAENV